VRGGLFFVARTPPSLAWIPLPALSPLMENDGNRAEDQNTNEGATSEFEYDDEWLLTAPQSKPKLFSYDWAKGTNSDSFLVAKRAVF